MKVGALIELLSKNDWNARVKLDLGRNGISPIDSCEKIGEEIRSVSSFTCKGKPIVTLNIRK